MSDERDLAQAIHHEIISPESVDAALNRWRHRAPDDAERDRMWFVLAMASEHAIEAVLAHRQREAARAGPWGEPPRASDIVDENFTGGLASEDYLERLRRGEP